MASNIVKSGVTTAGRLVQPLSSLDKAEAQRKVRSLFKAWSRQIPYMKIHYELFYSNKELHDKMKQQFLKNKAVEDIRVIDYLIFRGQLELYETVNAHKTKAHILHYWKDETPQFQKPKDFLGKFLDGH